MRVEIGTSPETATLWYGEIAMNKAAWRNRNDLINQLARWICDGLEITTGTYTITHRGGMDSWWEADHEVTEKEIQAAERRAENWRKMGGATP